MTRREFLVSGAMGMLAASGCRLLNGRSGTGPKLGLAGWTLNSFKTDEALAICEKYGYHGLCVKDFHLPYDATSAEISEFRRKCADHGVTPYGVGPIEIRSAESTRRRFDYAAALGVDLLVGVPGVKRGKTWRDVCSDRGLCEVCSGLSDEYGMKFAIHNHGRNPETGAPKLYPAVPETYEMIKDLSPRMGFCVDWAYTYADGLDCVEIVRTYAERIYDCHVRCISDRSNGSSGVNPARRVFDYDGIVAALKAVGYNGYLGLELADAFPKTPEWLAESHAYFTRLIEDR